MTKQDCHPADIIAALHKRGTSMAAVSREAGLASSTLANALSRPRPKGEWLIARALNVHPAKSGLAVMRKKANYGNRKIRSRRCRL